jgi:hypothetical protein
LICCRGASAYAQINLGIVAKFLKIGIRYLDTQGIIQQKKVVLFSPQRHRGQKEVIVFSE